MLDPSAQLLLKIFGPINALMATLVGWQTAQVNQIRQAHLDCKTKTDKDIAVLQSEFTGIKEDLVEIKQDVKEILRNGRK